MGDPNTKKNGFLPKILAAIKSGNLHDFEQLVGDSHFTKLTKQQLKAHKYYKDLQDLINFQDQETGNTVFHLLQSKDFKWFGKKKRHVRAVMFYRLLFFAVRVGNTAPLDKDNHSRETPLHFAIRKGYTNLVEKLLKAGVDISKNTPDGMSTLELAAKYKRDEIYKQLLTKHNQLNEDSDKAKGYTCAQIDAAKNLRIETLKRKQVALGFFGTAMTIACPVGAVLAFNELPLLELFFAGLIPGIGPFIGLGGAIIFGLLLYLSVYQKSGEKFGAYAQEMVKLDATSAKLLRLESELNEVNEKLENPSLHTNYYVLDAKKKGLETQLDDLYDSIPFVEEDFNAMPSDAINSSDEFRTYMLTGASFLCAFSGIMGLIGGISSFIPALTATTVVFAGIPVVGWAALGIALVVGIGVAAWAYHAKFKPTLVQCGQAVEKINSKKCALSEKKTQYMKSKSAPTPGYSNRTILDHLEDSDQDESSPVPNNDYSPFDIEETTMDQFMLGLSINKMSRNNPIFNASFSSSADNPADPNLLFSKSMSYSSCT